MTFVVALLSVGLNATAEGTTVEGSVSDAATNLPVRGAWVRAGSAAVQTDAGGHFRIGPLPASSRLEISAAGYLALEIPVESAHGLVAAALVADRGFRDRLDVLASSSAEGPSTDTVEPERVLQSAGAADNIFRLLRTLPGVTATADISSRLSVRGGGPDQNLTVMDGVEIHNPYRLFSLTSAFNPETVARFGLTAGAFSVKYGDRLSSLLIVENRPGTVDRALAGSATVGLTDANVVTEGRLPGRAAGSWLLTARRTYYDLVAQRFTDNDLPGFFDLQFNGQWFLKPGERLRLQTSRSREDSDASVKGYFQGEGADFSSLSRGELVALSLASTLGGKSHLDTIVAWSNNSDSMSLAGHFTSGLRRSNAPDDSGVSLDYADFDRSFVVRDASLRQELAWSVTPRHLVEIGYELHALDSQIAFTIRGERNPLAVSGTSILGGAGLPDELDSRSHSPRAGTWIQDRMRLSSTLTAEAGLRLDWSQLTRGLALQPRLSLTLEPGPESRLRAALGVHAQSPGYEKLYQSDDFLDLSRARQLGLRNERAWHALLGYERTLGAGVSARVEAYYRHFDRLILGVLESDPERERRLAEYEFPAQLESSLPRDPIVTTTPDNSGSGRAYGVDVYLERKPTASHARLTGWIAYTYGVAARSAYGRTYAFAYDRRHALSVVARQLVGAKLELGVTTRIASGFPRTPPLGLRVAAVPDSEDLDGDGDRRELVPERDEEGRLVYQPDNGGVSNFNTARLPVFARCDARASFWPRGRQGRWELYVDVINVFNRKNAELLRPQLTYDPESDRPRMQEHPLSSIGILPSLGVRLRF